MANNLPSSGSSHWCQGVLEETNLHNPLAAPSMHVPPPLQQHQQQQPTQHYSTAYPNTNSYYPAPIPQASYHTQQYPMNSSNYYQTGQSVVAPQGASKEYLNHYDHYRYNHPPSSQASSAYAPNNSQPHLHANHHPQSQFRPQAMSQSQPQATSAVYPARPPSETSHSWRGSPPTATSHPPVAPTSTIATGTLKKPSRFSTNPPAPSTSQANIPASAPVPVQKKENNGFPPSLKAYVERAFASCKTDEDRKVIETHLKDLIGRVTADGRLHKHRWDLESTPRLGPQNPQPTATLSKFSGPVSSQPQYYTDLQNTHQVRDVHNQYTVNGEAKKRKSRFSVETNISSSTTGDYSYNPATSPVPSPKRNKKVKSGASIYGPGLSPKVMSIYGPSSPSAAQSRADALSRESRTQRFSSSTQDDDSAIGKYGPGKGKKGNNKKKGQNKAMTATVAPVPQAPIVPLTEEDLENMKVIGTCQQLEKDYFRLTSAPNPNTVRPEKVLRRALEFVKSKWNNEKHSNKEINSYVLSQFKSLRQDLTLQHITNELTVEVYESHARIELEKGDLNEYNQCQTQLKQLYARGLQGSEKEFIAYRILYYLYLQGNKKYQSGSQDLLHLMASLSEETMRDPSVAHALELRRALLQDNYHRFFSLYKRTPSLGNCILDLMVAAYRFKTLQRMFKSYKPSIDEQFVIRELGFESEDAGREFLKSAGCLSLPGSEVGSHVLDTKNSSLVPPKDDSGLLL